MKPLLPYIDIREEMESIKEQQQKIALENEKVTYRNTRELWRLQIVWEYLRDKVILNDEAPSKDDYLN
jgi:hypothetical protein